MSIRDYIDLVEKLNEAGWWPGQKRAPLAPANATDLVAHAPAAKPRPTPSAETSDAI